LLWVWKAVVMLCLTPSCFIKATHTAEENCTPRSEVKEAGTPNLDTQPLTNVPRSQRRWSPAAATLQPTWWTCPPR
jgi:hypothetical protein